MKDPKPKGNQETKGMNGKGNRRELQVREPLVPNQENGKPCKMYRIQIIKIDILILLP